MKDLKINNNIARMTINVTPAHKCHSVLRSVISRLLGSCLAAVVSSYKRSLFQMDVFDQSSTAETSRSRSGNNPCCAVLAAMHPYIRCGHMTPCGLGDGVGT